MRMEHSRIRIFRDAAVDGCAESGPARRFHPRLEIVIPLLNEEKIVRELHRRTAAAAALSGVSWRVIYVDDGSCDGTAEYLADLVRSGEPVQVVRLSRNFGQPAAIHAGLAGSVADAVVVLDGDLQDPPELIPQMFACHRAGAEVVIARRRSRSESSRFRRVLFAGFHRFFSRLSDIPVPPHCGTYSLLGRRAVDGMLAMPEAHRYFPGLRAWVGYRQEFVDYDRADRAAGSPRQTLRRLIRYAGDAVFGFSARPVVWMGYGSAVAAAACGLLIAAAMLLWLRGGASGEFLLFAGGGGLAGLAAVQLASMAYIAELVRRTYDQSKQRPTYVIESMETAELKIDRQSQRITAA